MYQICMYVYTTYSMSHTYTVMYMSMYLQIDVHLLTDVYCLYVSYDILYDSMSVYM